MIRSSSGTGRARWLVAGALIAVTSLAACGSGGSGSADGTVELTFRQFDPPGEIAGLEAAVERFNAQQSGIQVEIDTVAVDEALNGYVREVQAGGGPDIAQLQFVWPKDLSEGGLLLDLGPLQEAAPLEDAPETFLGSDLTTLEGTTWAIPWTADTFAMAYRPDLLEQAGITAFPETWEELRTAATALTRDGQFGFCFPAASGPQSGIWFLANYYLWSNGATLVEDAGGTYRVAVDPQQAAGAMEYFSSFLDSGANPQSSIGISSWGDPELVGALGRGECAIEFMPPQTFRAAQAGSEAELATAPVPRGTEPRISHLGGRALGINPNTEHPEEAWTFLSFLTSDEAFETLSQYPARRSVLADYVFPEGETGYQELLPEAQTFASYIRSPATVSSMQEVTNREFGAVFSGQRPPGEAGAGLVAGLEELLNDG